MMRLIKGWLWKLLGRRYKEEHVKVCACRPDGRAAEAIERVRRVADRLQSEMDVFYRRDYRGSDER